MKRTEDKIIKRYGYKKVIASGAFPQAKGDAVEYVCIMPGGECSLKSTCNCANCLHYDSVSLIEIKETDKKSYSLNKKVLDKIIHEAYAEGYEPKMIIRIQNLVLEVTLKERLT